MAATGSETIKLNQLKTYIKYISDEDLEAYLNDEAPSGITGNEVVTLAQVKKYLGSGGNVSYEQVWSGNYICSTSSYLIIARTTFGYGTTSKVRFTADYYTFGYVQDSGIFAFDLPSSLPDADHKATEIGTFVLSTDTFAIKAYVNNNNVVFIFNNNTVSSRLSYCHITKVEVA